jgi:uncharacterized protein YndB with AHSA1/START domain
MTTPFTHEIDPKLDLVLEREVPASVERLWAAWTTPEQLVQWFAPKPWTIAHAELDVRPGGKFHSVMRSPEGEEFPSTGCYLAVVEHELLVWTSALGPGYRPTPQADDDLPFTAILTFEDNGSGGTRYRAIAAHPDEALTKRHEEMGFHEGWGTVLDQLVEFAQ